MEPLDPQTSSNQGHKSGFQHENRGSTPGWSQQVKSASGGRNDTNHSDFVKVIIVEYFVFFFLSYRQKVLDLIPINVSYFHTGLVYSIQVCSFSYIDICLNNRQVTLIYSIVFLFFFGLFQLRLCFLSGEQLQETRRLYPGQKGRWSPADLRGRPGRGHCRRLQLRLLPHLSTPVHTWRPDLWAVRDRKHSPLNMLGRMCNCLFPIDGSTGGEKVQNKELNHLQVLPGLLVPLYKKQNQKSNKGKRRCSRNVVPVNQRCAHLGELYKSGGFLILDKYTRFFHVVFFLL